MAGRENSIDVSEMDALFRATDFSADTNFLETLIKNLQAKADARAVHPAPAPALGHPWPSAENFADDEDALDDDVLDAVVAARGTPRRPDNI